MDIEKTAKKAFQKAAKKTIDAGFSFLCVRDGYLVEVFPDGEVKKIKKVHKWLKVDKKEYKL